jgi:peptidoglycan/LPS O-acetylase OafA/YrhL
VWEASYESLNSASVACLVYAGAGMVVGLLRVLLALAVLISHSHSLFGLKLMEGTEAVQVFFILSGFYIAMILAEKYDQSYKLFITNRFLRIYPIYYVILFLMVVGALLMLVATGTIGNALKPFADVWSSIQWSSFAVVIIVNLILFGLDILSFMGLDKNGALHLLSGQQTAQRWSLLLILPAWTLSIELMFYLLAPLIVRLKSWILVFIAVASAGGGFMLVAAGYPSDLWMMRLFPTQIGFFILGVLSYRSYVHLRQREVSRGTCRVIAYAVIAVTICYQFIPLPALIRLWVFLAIVSCTLPFIFMYAKDSRFDRLLGELSYPVYLVHMAVIGTLIRIFTEFHLATDSCWFEVLIITSSLLASYVLYRIVIVPIDRYRRRRVEMAKSARSVSL